MMVLASVAICTPAVAQGLETVVVSASPPDPVGAKAFSVTTLGPVELREAPFLDASLSEVPGLSLFRRNSSLSANPGTQGVSLRSIAPSGAGRALVMLDGVPQNDPFGGWVIWSALPPELISSAEVVRGAGAGPYGAGALTGVIALKEATGSVLDVVASGGSMGQRRAVEVASAALGPVSLLGEVGATAGDGWIPVSPFQRGSADDKVTLDAHNASVRAQFEPDDSTLISTRISAWQESRQSGLVGTRSFADGVRASVAAAHSERGSDLGWRLQAWLQVSNFGQTSASVAAGRNTATPSNNQYATPAIGWGANAALRGTGFLDWETGVDLRASRGNSKEQVNFRSGAYTQGRTSGGASFIGGIYAEAARRNDVWLLTLGGRVDGWSTYNGHVDQTDLASGALTVQHWSSRFGVLPTARAGLRREFDGFYLRTAAYEGFRAPSLNELYRPFRLGNNVTIANATLSPETLSGVEIGAGGADGRFSWDATLFFNRLHAAITNVTIGQGPVTVPNGGFVPAGGLLIQRQNVGDTNAPGIEGNLAYAAAAFSVRGPFDWLDQRVHGGRTAPQLTGKRPSQAPRATITGGIDVPLSPELTSSVSVRYESNRWADDANTLALGSAVTIGARLSWAVTQEMVLFVATDNLLNARIATTETADGVTSYDAPRALSAGLSFRR